MLTEDKDGEGRITGTVRHADLHRLLAAEIGNRKYPVGARFPTESDLQERFGVGRHTVREALKALADDGYIGRRQRSGTVVLARNATPRYSQAVGSIGGLLELGRGTRLNVVEFGVAGHSDSRFMDMLDLQGPASGWQCVAGLRKRRGYALPLCWSEIYVPNAYPIPRTRASTLKEPIFMLLKRQYGLDIAQVKQVIRAASIPAATALELHVAAGSPGLLQLLKFYAADGQLFDAAVSLYPSDRYSFNSEFQASDAG